LKLGTWSAFGVIAAGLLAWLLHREVVGERVMLTGIAIIVALPAMRVSLMLEHFYRSRQRLFAALCLLVLLIMAAGVGVGLSLRTGAG